jgi:isoquinoline 1-oxidoreductase alpha subunit
MLVRSSNGTLIREYALSRRSPDRADRRDRHEGREGESIGRWYPSIPRSPTTTRRGECTRRPIGAKTDDMPLLWTLRDVLNMNGTKFGAAWGCAARARFRSTGSRPAPAPLSVAAGKRTQHAWLVLNVPQCGNCQSGQIMSASPSLYELWNDLLRRSELLMRANRCAGSAPSHSTGPKCRHRTRRACSTTSASGR